MDDELLTIAQAAEMLGKSKDTIRRKIKSKQIKASKVAGPYGKEWRIRRADLLEDTAQEVIDVIPVWENLKPGQLLVSIEEMVNKAVKEAMLLPVMEENRRLKEENETLKRAQGLLPGKTLPFWKRIFRR